MTQSPNYSVIADLDKLTNFVEWLPELKDDEKYYFTLMARQKYIRDRSNVPKIDKVQCSRFAVGNKERIIPRIKQLECPVGSYQFRELIVPQEALALYVTINPRSESKAFRAMLKRVADVIADNIPNKNLYQESLTCLHQSIGTKHFLDFDIDIEDNSVDINDIINQIDGKILNREAFTVLQTRGGVHIIVQLEKIAPQYVKTWHRQLSQLTGVDVIGDNMIPVPGTYQGGFVPSFIS